MTSRLEQKKNLLEIMNYRPRANKCSNCYFFRQMGSTGGPNEYHCAYPNVVADLKIDFDGICNFYRNHETYGKPL